MQVPKYQEKDQNSRGTPAVTDTSNGIKNNLKYKPTNIVHVRKLSIFKV